MKLTDLPQSKYSSSISVTFVSVDVSSPFSPLDLLIYIYRSNGQLKSDHSHIINLVLKEWSNYEYDL